MKLKVTMVIPSVSVSTRIEVGNIKNNELTERQQKLVDKAVDEELNAAMNEKIKRDAFKPKIKLSF